EVRPARQPHRAAVAGGAGRPANGRIRAFAVAMRHAREHPRGRRACHGPRESILAGAVLGMAGPGRKISGIMPCTVIRPGDMADNILDRNKHPEWSGDRMQMGYSFPATETPWTSHPRAPA